MMNTLITRIFLATAPGELNKTKAQKISVPLTEPKSPVECCQRTPTKEHQEPQLKSDPQLLAYLMGMLAPDDLAEVENEQATSDQVAEDQEIARRMHYNDFAGCVVDLDCTHNNTLPASGRWLCIQQAGNRLTLLPLAILGYQMLSPTYVSFGGNGVKVVDVEPGDEEWEHAYDALMEFGTKLFNYYKNNGVVKDEQMPSIYYYHTTPERGMLRAEGEGLIAKRIYHMLVDCE